MKRGRLEREKDLSRQGAAASDEVRFQDSGGVHRTPETGESALTVKEKAKADSCRRGDRSEWQVAGTYFSPVGPKAPCNAPPEFPIPSRIDLTSLGMCPTASIRWSGAYRLDGC